MKLVATGAYVEAIPESPSETKKLQGFPGMHKNGPRFLAPQKVLVVQNLIRRLKSTFGSLSADERVYNIAKGKLQLKPLPSAFTYHTSPKVHQDIALRFLYTVLSGGLLLDPGMGKTKVYLDYIWLMGFKRSIVVCPMALLTTWEDEVATHRPELKVHLVRTTNWAAELPLMKEANLVVINYDKAVRLVQGLCEEIHFDSMNIDEGLIKDPKTARTGALTQLGRGIKHRVLNSGTLINNSPLDMFAPVRYLEPSLVGSSYSVFKSRYAIEKKLPNSKVTLIVGYEHVEEMRDTLDSCCIVMTKEEWLKDLPGKTFKIVDCGSSEEQRRVFGELQSNYVSEFQGRNVEIPSPLVLAAKQCQVANGFIYYTEQADLLEDEMEIFGEGQFTKSAKKKKAAIGPREILFFEDQPKVRRLKTLLTEELANRRVMIWYNLNAEKTLIEAALIEMGISFLTVAGGEKDTGGKIRTFNRDKAFTVLLCQAKAVNYGVTVLGHREDREVDPDTVFISVDSQVYTQVFFSLNFSLEVFLQQQDRIHRIGQIRDCEYYVLLSDFDVEHYVYKVLEDKKSVKETMMIDFVKGTRVQLDA